MKNLLYIFLGLSLMFGFSDDEGNNDCSINDLEITVGECNADGTYSLTLNFDYENPGNDYFLVYVRGDLLIDYYELAELPLTIKDFEISELDYDYIRVCINDVADCCQEMEWETPDC